MPDLVDDKGRLVDAAVFDEPEEIEEARTSFSVPSSRERLTWPPLTRPPTVPELFPLQEAPTVQASPSAIPDQCLLDLSASLPSTRESLRVTLDCGPNSQLYIYNLRLRPSAANYVGALIMMDRCTFFVDAALYI